MTNEEMERAIETVLNNQANYKIQLERTNKRLELIDKRLEQFGKMHTDERLNSLINTGERFISRGGNGEE